MSKKKDKIEDGEKIQEEKELSLDEEKKQYEEKEDFKDLIDQVNAEYKLAWDFMKPKLDEWELRLKLYNNQKRDKKAYGNSLLFTVIQTLLASLYSDKLNSEFSAREEGDEEIAENLNALARYDEDDMQKDILDYDWSFNTAFFGRGLCLFMGFDTKTKTPIPEIIDNMTWVRDPQATSVNGDRYGRGSMRFGGREIRLTKSEMRKGKIYFNIDKLDIDSTDPNSILDRAKEARKDAQGYNNPTKDSGRLGDNQDYRLLEWFTHYKGSKVLVTLGNNRKKIVRYTIIKEDTWPIIDRSLYPIAHDWDGVSIPDLVEDKQRMKAVIENLSVKQIETNLRPHLLYDTNKIKNKADLNYETNKFIGIDGVPSGAIQAVQQNHVGSDTTWILSAIDTAAQRATATPEMQQGAVSGERRTASEINLISSKVDTRYSLTAKIFGWSEKRFWQQWYYLYKKHFSDKIYEKQIRILGITRSQWQKLERKDIIMKVDPDVDIESKVITEGKRIQKVQSFRTYIADVMNILGGQGANLQFALKRLGKLQGLKQDEINRILAPNVDEMDAEEENQELNENKKVEVDPMEDDVVHIDVHGKAKDTEQKEKHIEAHRRNMLLKKQNPELFPALAQGQQAGANPINDMMTGQAGPQGNAPGTPQVPVPPE